MRVPKSQRWTSHRRLSPPSSVVGFYFASLVFVAMLERWLAFPTTYRNVHISSHYVFGDIGVRANIHLGGQTEFCPNGFSGGGVVAEIFRDPYSVGGGGSSRNFPGSIFSGGGGSSRHFPGSILCVWHNCFS